MKDFLQILFDEEDQVCAGNMYATGVQHYYLGIQGPYISINPLHTSRLDSNVTKHRNFLVEMDQGSLDEQMKRVKDSGLPFSYATWSGSKSIHFIVSLETPVDEVTWRRWAAALIKAVGSDPATKNPSRFTRLPGHYRTDKECYQNPIISGKRIPNEVVAKFVEPHLDNEEDYRALYNEMTGTKGLDATHPLTKAFIAGTHQCSQGRNNALFKSACDLKRCGFDKDQASALLIDSAVLVGLSMREINQTINSAYRR